MSKSFDIVVMGAGHNGLTAAAYLAKAGKKVLVLERQAFPGGGVVTREINTPGYRHDLHSSCHIMIQGNPMLTEDELGLFGKFGLKYNYSKVPYASIFPDQSTLITYKDLDAACAEIAKLSRKDADTYRAFATRSMAMLPMFVAGLYAPPIPLGPFMAMLDSSDEGREMLDAMSRSSLDIIDDAFENDRVKIHLLKLVTENLQLPDELGTGMGIYLMPGIIHTYGVSQPVGGSGGLTDALVRCVEAYGGEIRLNAEVAQILVKSGRATGVRLADGEEIPARDAVIGAIHPHRLATFVPGLPAAAAERARRVNTSTFSLFVSHYDLRERTKYYAGEEITSATMLEYFAFDKLSELLDDFDHLRRGRIPPRPITGGGDETHADPTRAPAGRRDFPRDHNGPVQARGRRAEALGRDQGARGGEEPRLLSQVHRQPRRRQHHCAHALVAAGHGALVAEQLRQRRHAWRRAVPVSDHGPPPDPGPRTVHGAGRRAALSRRTVHASGRRRLWRGPCDRDPNVRRSRDRFRPNGEEVA